MRIICGKCKKVGEAEEVIEYVQYRCISCGALNETNNITLNEWLGFKYNKFLKSIEAFIKKDPFENLAAKNSFERTVGKLSERQVDKLKSVLIDSFKKGDSIRDIKNAIDKEVGVKDLLKTKDGELVYEDGTPVIQTPKHLRTSMIARTETTRTASEGALNNYKDNGIAQVQFLSALSQRTCLECEELNGRIMSLEEAKETIPVHIYCRCTWMPVIK